MSKSYTVDMVSAIGRTALVLPRVLSEIIMLGVGMVGPHFLVENY